MPAANAIGQRSAFLGMIKLQNALAYFVSLSGSKKFLDLDTLTASVFSSGSLSGKKANQGEMMPKIEPAGVTR